MLELGVGLFQRLGTPLHPQLQFFVEAAQIVLDLLQLRDVAVGADHPQRAPLLIADQHPTLAEQPQPAAGAGSGSITALEVINLALDVGDEGVAQPPLVGGMHVFQVVDQFRKLRIGGQFSAGQGVLPANAASAEINVPHLVAAAPQRQVQAVLGAAQRLFIGAQFGDVEGRSDHADCTTLSVASEHPTTRQQPAPLAIDIGTAITALEQILGTLHTRHQRIAKASAIVRMHERRVRLQGIGAGASADVEMFQPVATGELAGAQVGVPQLAATAPQRVLQHRFALRQRIAGAFALVQAQPVAPRGQRDQQHKQQGVAESGPGPEPRRCQHLDDQRAAADDDVAIERIDLELVFAGRQAGECRHPARAIGFDPVAVASEHAVAIAERRRAPQVKRRKLDREQVLVMAKPDLRRMFDRQPQWRAFAERDHRAIVDAQLGQLHRCRTLLEAQSRRFRDADQALGTAKMQTAAAVTRRRGNEEVHPERRIAIAEAGELPGLGGESAQTARRADPQVSIAAIEDGTDHRRCQPLRLRPGLQRERSPIAAAFDATDAATLGTDPQRAAIVLKQCGHAFVRQRERAGRCDGQRPPLATARIEPGQSGSTHREPQQTVARLQDAVDRISERAGLAIEVGRPRAQIFAALAQAEDAALHQADPQVAVDIDPQRLDRAGRQRAGTETDRDAQRRSVPVQQVDAAAAVSHPDAARLSQQAGHLVGRKRLRIVAVAPQRAAHFAIRIELDDAAAIDHAQPQGGVVIGADCGDRLRREPFGATVADHAIVFAFRIEQGEAAGPATHPERAQTILGQGDDVVARQCLRVAQAMAPAGQAAIRIEPGQPASGADPQPPAGVVLQRTDQVIRQSAATIVGAQPCLHPTVGGDQKHARMQATQRVSAAGARTRFAQHDTGIERLGQQLPGDRAGGVDFPQHRIADDHQPAIFVHMQQALPAGESGHARHRFELPGRDRQALHAATTRRRVNVATGVRVHRCHDPIAQRPAAVAAVEAFETPGRRIEAVQSVLGCRPDAAIGTLGERQDVVVTERCRLTGDLPEHAEAITIETVQSVLGGDPEKALAILEDVDRRRLREAGDGAEADRSRRARPRRSRMQDQQQQQATAQGQ